MTTTIDSTVIGAATPEETPTPKVDKYPSEEEGSATAFFLLNMLYLRDEDESSLPTIEEAMDNADWVKVAYLAYDFHMKGKGY